MNGLWNNDEVNNKEIFQQFIRNKERGFKRTSPTANAVPNKSAEFKCELCDYIAENKSNLNDHTIRVHRITRRPDIQRQTADQSRQSKVLYCHHWNNSGSCNYEERNGRPCKFEHKEAPRCSFDGNCDRKTCMFVHKSQNKNFLGNKPRGFRPPPPQPWEMLMSMLGLQGVNNHGVSRGGNQRRF